MKNKFNHLTFSGKRYSGTKNGWYVIINEISGAERGFTFLQNLLTIPLLVKINQKQESIC